MAEVKIERSSLDISDLPGNSIKAKAMEDKPKPKHVANTAMAKKPGLGRKFADVFLGEEIGDVKSYILQDVVVPTIKNTIIDVVCGGIEMLLLGKVSGRRNSYSSNRSSGGYVPYNSYYSGVGNGRPQDSHTQPRQPVGNRYGIDDLIFRTHGEASDVLAAMFDYMKDYDGMISVADLYEMVGHPSEFTDHAWGWTDLGGASVRRVRDGYLLVLPRAVSLK